MSKGPNPFLLGDMLAKRKAGGRAQRRAAEAMERKASIPALKKVIRRNKQRQKKK